MITGTASWMGRQAGRQTVRVFNNNDENFVNNENKFLVEQVRNQILLLHT